MEYLEDHYNHPEHKTCSVVTFRPDAEALWLLHVRKAVSATGPSTWDMSKKLSTRFGAGASRTGLAHTGSTMSTTDSASLSFLHEYMLISLVNNGTTTMISAVQLKYPPNICARLVDGMAAASWIGVEDVSLDDWAVLGHCASRNNPSS